MTEKYTHIIVTKKAHPNTVVCAEGEQWEAQMPV